MKITEYVFALSMASIPAFTSQDWKQEYVGKLVNELDVTKTLEGALVEDDLWMTFVEIDGARLLFLQKSIGRAEKKAIFRIVDAVNPNLASDEFYSYVFGFPCKTKNGEWTFSIFKKANAKEKGTFLSERSWLFNVEEESIETVEPAGVTCKWEPEGEYVFPPWKN